MINPFPGIERIVPPGVELVQEIVPPSVQLGWPIIPLIGAIVVGSVGALILIASRYYDRESKGFLTISILIVFAFITATFASMIYSIQLNPITEILVGALATALGAIVSQWGGTKQRLLESESDQERKVSSKDQTHEHRREGE
jgi:peptidoglycan/LPS O-acetylase OafA/YrhL